MWWVVVVFSFGREGGWLGGGGGGGGESNGFENFPPKLVFWNLMSAVCYKGIYRGF